MGRKSFAHERHASQNRSAPHKTDFNKKAMHLLSPVKRARANKGQIMKLLQSLLLFTFTMIASLIAFTYTAIHFPTTMRELLSGAQHVRDQMQSLYLPDNFMVWVDIFLQPNQIVLVGISIAMRFVIGIIGSFVSRNRTPKPTPRSDPASNAGTNPAFGRWG
jgi:hypothetical protein